MLTRIMTTRTFEEFSPCRFAQNETIGSLRDCTHPGLRGLKTVTPKLCSNCYYRVPPAADVFSDLLGDTRLLECEPYRLWDCAHLAPDQPGRSETDSIPPDSRLGGTTNECASNHHLLSVDTSLDTWLDQPYECGHPAYEKTTRRSCGLCPAYLFPRFSPRMSVSDARRLLEAQRNVQPDSWWKWPNVQAAFRELTDAAIAHLPSHPASFSGRGIVIAGGGRYFPSAYITIRVLRHVGCRLPIQLWHLTGEMDDVTRSLVSPFDVTCFDAEDVCRQQNHRFHPSWWRGWQLKPFAILHSSFEEILYLDADSYPTRNPEFLFDWPGYRQHGAIFWPDIDDSAILLPRDRPPIFGIVEFEDRPTESGQLLINKRECWRELNLAWFYNSHAEFTYRVLWGDKDTFPIAWKRLGREYARMWPTASANGQAVLQYDDAGCLLFQHRATDKFRLPGTRFDSTQQRPGANQYNPSLIHEDFCFATLDELRELLIRNSDESSLASD